MSFTQTSDDCPEHAGCVRTVCHADEAVTDPDTGAEIHPAGAQVWESHASSP